MNKLMISSMAFVSLMSTTNFIFLRLDHFIQLLHTFSVGISVEFVFSNLCLTVSENLLSLSLQEESLSVHCQSCVSEFSWTLETCDSNEQTTGLPVLAVVAKTAAHTLLLASHCRTTMRPGRLTPTMAGGNDELGTIRR